MCESTQTEELKVRCTSLIIEAKGDGKELKDQAELIWNQVSQSNKKHMLKCKVVNELKKIGLVPEDLKLLMESNHSEADDFYDLLVLISTENDPVKYSQNKAFVKLIEHLICKLKGHKLDFTLQCYSHILRLGKHEDSDCLFSLIQRDRKKSPSSFNEALFNVSDWLFSLMQRERKTLPSSFFEALFYANMRKNIPEQYLSIVFENVANSDNFIRRFAFKIMRYDPRCKSIFLDYCILVHTRLQKMTSFPIEMNEDLLDLLETVVSVKYLDIDIFTRSNGSTIQELLISDVFTNLEDSSSLMPFEQMEINKAWIEIQESFSLAETTQIALMVQQCCVTSCCDLLEMLQIIPCMTIEEVMHVLIYTRLNAVDAMKQCWALKHLNEKIPTPLYENYSKRVVKHLCSNFSFQWMTELFKRIKVIDNLRLFEEIIELCVKEEIDISETRPGNVTMTGLKHDIECNCLFSIIKPSSKRHEKMFIQTYHGLRKLGWVFEELQILFKDFSKSYLSFANVVNVLKTIRNYNVVPSNLKSLRTIFAASKGFNGIISSINLMAVENHFQNEGKVKDLNELLNEIQSSNTLDDDFTEAIVNGYFDVKKHIFDNHRDKLKWNKNSIFEWATEVQDGKTFTDYEGIAVTLRANQIVTGHILTYTQILCCLIALRSNTNKLLQVSTGEGKSTITCILAIIARLRGKKVDVITSSPVLAERDARDKAILYEHFNLTCSYNSDRTLYIKGKKDCYDCDVVYGEMSQFQFDFLRDSYSKLGTMGNRETSVAIVDEVDSMLIDDAFKVARLSTSIPGIDQLEVSV